MPSTVYRPVVYLDRKSRPAMSLEPDGGGEGIACTPAGCCGLVARFVLGPVEDDDGITVSVCHRDPGTKCPPRSYVCFEVEIWCHPWPA